MAFGLSLVERTADVAPIAGTALMAADDDIIGKFIELSLLQERPMR